MFSTYSIYLSHFDGGVFTVNKLLSSHYPNLFINELLHLIISSLIHENFKHCIIFAVNISILRETMKSHLNPNLHSYSCQRVFYNQTFSIAASRKKASGSSSSTNSSKAYRLPATCLTFPKYCCQSVSPTASAFRAPLSRCH